MISALIFKDDDSPMDGDRTNNVVATLIHDPSNDNKSNFCFIKYPFYASNCSCKTITLLKYAHPKPNPDYYPSYIMQF